MLVSKFWSELAGCSYILCAFRLAVAKLTATCFHNNAIIFNSTKCPNQKCFFKYQTYTFTYLLKLLNECKS